MTDRTKALDELIAGDADLYDVPKFPDHIGETVPAGVIEQFARDLESGDFDNVSDALNARMCCNGYACGCRGSTVGEYLAHELLTASARITGDKGRRESQSSAPTEPQWQPIETAPEDGSFVVLYAPAADPCVSIGYYDGGPDWLIVEGDIMPTNCRPNFWMPLPAPPA